MAIGICKPLRRIAEPFAPISTSAPSRRFEHQAALALLRQHGVALVISADHRRALAHLEEIEGGEQRKVGAFVKDQRRLQTAVGQEDAIGKLWKLFAISRHAEFLPANKRHLFRQAGYPRRVAWQSQAAEAVIANF